MNANADFQVGIQREVVWKNDEVRHFALCLVRSALEQGGSAAATFTTDIVPDSERGTGSGIAGTVIEILKNANVIEPVGLLSGAVFYPVRIKSSRPGRHSAYVNVYRLRGYGIAREFLKRNENA